MDPGHDRCPRCLFQERVCLCADIPVVPTRTRVVIVRHHLERWRSSNSGRLAHLALPNSAIVEYGGGTETRRLDPRHGGAGGSAELPDLTGAWLLFPEGPVHDAPPPEPPRQLVVLDATWSQARRMFRKLAALRGLPMLRLAEAPMPAARLRAAPAPGMVSTIEAIARALRLLEGDGVATPLEALFQIAVRRAAQTGRQLENAR